MKYIISLLMLIVGFNLAQASEAVLLDFEKLNSAGGKTDSLFKTYLNLTGWKTFVLSTDNRYTAAGTLKLKSFEMKNYEGKTEQHKALLIETTFTDKTSAYIVRPPFELYAGNISGMAKQFAGSGLTEGMAVLKRITVTVPDNNDNAGDLYVLLKDQDNIEYCIYLGPLDFSGGVKKLIWVNPNYQSEFKWRYELYERDKAEKKPEKKYAVYFSGVMVKNSFRANGNPKIKLMLKEIVLDGTSLE